MKTQDVLKGHPVSLFVLDYGLFRVNVPERTIGIPGFLVQTNLGEQILIDTGFPAKYTEDTQAAALADRLHEFGEVVHCTPGNLPSAQLALAGASLGRINLMIQTHTHIDHVGGIAACPQAPVLMARAERALDRPVYWGQVQPLDWPEREYILIEEDTWIGPGFQVLFTPGHTPGQLALFLHLPHTGAVLLTSDAVSRPSEPDEGFDGSWNADLATQHAERIIDKARQTQALIIYGHCPDQWKTLKKAPDFYR